MANPSPQAPLPVAQEPPASARRRLGRKLRLLVSGPEGQDGGTQTFADYEAGKRRRYELLFAVNGGAYALAIWLAGETRDQLIQIGGLAAHHIGMGMAAFTAIMRRGRWQQSLQQPCHM